VSENQEAGRSARTKAGTKTRGSAEAMQKSGLASTAKVFRFEAEDHKIKKRDATWMWRLWGTVGWSSFNQGWFKSRAVSSRKQEHRVSTLGKATSLGFICERRRMRIALRSTYPFFWGPFFWGPFLFGPGPTFFLSLVLSLGLAQVSLAEGNPFTNKHDGLKEVDPSAKAASGEIVRQAPPLPRDQRVMDAARMYEKYFLNQMVKAMRSTVKYSDLQKPTMGEEIYRDQLDDQYVDSWAQTGGIGLADMIHDELLGKAQMNKLRREAMKASKGKTRTPLALTDRDVLAVRRLPGSLGDTGSASSETVLVSLAKTAAAKSDAPESVRSPWDGEIVQIQANHGKVLIDLKVGSKKSAGRAVQIAFDGVTFDGTGGASGSLRIGNQIKAGQVIGHLAPSARGILIRQEAPETKVQVGVKRSTTADSGL
jgi:Rod binding domain-containing protein